MGGFKCQEEKHAPAEGNLGILCSQTNSQEEATELGYCRRGLLICAQEPQRDPPRTSPRKQQLEVGRG